MNFDFIRFLRLSGLLLEAMTPNQAKAIFTQYGASDADFLTPAALKLARNKIIRLHHSDLTRGNDEDAGVINAAYDTLKSATNFRSSSTIISRWKRRQSVVSIKTGEVGQIVDIRAGTPPLYKLHWISIPGVTFLDDAGQSWEKETDLRDLQVADIERLRKRNEEPNRHTTNLRNR
jgi:hypothetical protein